MLAGNPAPAGLHFYTEWDRLSEGGAEAIQTWVEEHPAGRLIIVNVLARVRPRVGNRSDRYLADYEAAQPLKTVADKHGLAVVALHHTRKAGAEDFVETVQAPTGWRLRLTPSWFANGLGARPTPLSTSPVVTSRNEDLALRFDGGIGTWTLLGDAAEWALSETRRKLLAALREQGALTPKALADYTDIAHETAKKSLQRMALDGQVETAGGGAYRVPGVPLSPDSDLNGGDEGQRDGGDRVLDVPGDDRQAQKAPKCPECKSYDGHRGWCSRA